MQVYYIQNATVGGVGNYTITITTNTGGSTATIAANQQSTLICDSVNLVNANTVLAGSTALSLINGTVSSPALNFASESTTGVYRAASGEFNIAILGVLRSTLSASGLAIVGTGNFNERSSKIYTDFALLTGNKRVVSEVAKVFRLLENNLERVSFRNLLVSPINYRRKLLSLMDKEIALVNAGKPGSIKLKLNNLTDPVMIDKIVEASEAGVKVDMIVRGICCLKTNHKRNKNLSVISIVDRYLEHARCFVFGNHGSPLYYIGSADLMERNLDARIEVATPIFDPKIQAEIDAILDYQWRGTVKSRWIDSDMKNEYRQQEGPAFHAQQNLYYRYQLKD
ncbi:MAG: hypothetical protein EBR54_07725 [Flavobacteriia bacterium]|nr:hypothetical protein [Flavobacteriia bacterium]